MRPRDLVIALSLMAAVAFAILAMGGVLRWTQAITAVLTAVAVAGTAMSKRAFSRPSPLMVLLLAAAGLSLLQLLPLPGGLAERLVPLTSSLRADGAELMESSPWSAATADAGATLGSLIMLLTLAGIALAALRISTSERGRYRVVAGVAGLCGVTAIIIGVHRLVGATSLYGLYAPQDAEPRVLGPLLNTNSLACLMAIGATLGIALAAHRKQPGWLRIVWLLLVPACGLIIVATISRGGVIALAAGALVTVGILIAQRLAGNDRSKKRRVRFVANALPIGVIAGCVTILVIWSNAGNVERQLSQLSMEEVRYSRSKFGAWRSAAQLVEEQPLIGVGRGAFEAPFTRVHQASGLATYSHLENEYLQAIVDWGIPGSVVLGLIALWILYVAVRRWRDTSLSAGVLGALTVVAAQSNVDFGLEFLGLAAPVTALVASITYVPLRETERVGLARGLRLAHAAALLVGAALLLSSITTTLDEDRRALAARPTVAQARESATRHPLDYYSYAVAAELLHRNKDPRAIRLLNHALALHPTHPHLHRLAARMLYSDGFVSQSAIEYAAALRSTHDGKPLLGEILKRFSRDVAATAIPTDLDVRYVVTTLAELQHLDVARVWLTRVLDHRPKGTQACEQLFLLGQGGDLEAAQVAGKRCADRLPDYQTRVSLAKMMVTKNAHAEVLRLLGDVEHWQARRDDKIEAWLVLCDSHRALGDTDQAKRCLRRLDASPDMLDERRLEILRRIEEINATATGSAAPL